jgi:hypothetical protein
MFFLLAQQQPVVVDLTRQPAPTPSISYPGMLMSAIGIVGIIAVAAFIVGGLIGAIIIWRKRREDALAPPTDPGHHQLRI